MADAEAWFAALDGLQHQHHAAPANLDEAINCAQGHPDMHVGLRVCCVVDALKL